jgi:hypothetical protein
MVEKKENIRIRCRRYISGCSLASVILLVGCTTIKKAGVSATTAAVGATVATALSGGVAAPILGGTTGAFVGSAVSDLMITNPQSGFLRGKDMTNCAPDNFWSLLGSLVEMGGWLLLLLIFVPMVLGWILPGPLEKKKRRD